MQPSKLALARIPSKFEHVQYFSQKSDITVVKPSRYRSRVFITRAPHVDSTASRTTNMQTVIRCGSSCDQATRIREGNMKVSYRCTESEIRLISDYQ